MSDNTENAQISVAPRTVTLWSTKNNKKLKLQTSAATWGELQDAVTQHNREATEKFDLSGLLATENTRRTDLINKDAVLPEQAFVVYLRPKETKSGAEKSYKELRGEIKEFIEKDGDKAKAHFNEGKNYTTKSTDELRALHASYKPAKAKKADKEEVETINVVDVVESVAKTKVITNQDRIGIIRENLKAIVDSCPGNSDIIDRTDMANDEIDGLEGALISEGFAETVSGSETSAPAKKEKKASAPVEEAPVEEKESDEDRVKREEAEAKAEQERLDREAEEENRLLAEEAKNLSEGYKK